MKKLVVVFTLCVLCLAGVAARQFFVVSKKDGTQLNFAISEWNSIVFYAQGEHDYVDLGLPSGTLWATCNVGANAPEAYGDYFAWGETTPKLSYDWSTYKYGAAYNQLTKYCDDSSYGRFGFADQKTTLEASDDVATVNWGAGWRMPTAEQWEELKNKCRSAWTTLNGSTGRLFTGPNGNTLFLPAAGCYDGNVLDRAGSVGRYWSNSLYTDYPSRAYYLLFNSDGVYWSGEDRCYGYSVRLVVNR